MVSISTVIGTTTTIDGVYHKNFMTSKEQGRDIQRNERCNDMPASNTQ